MLRDDDNAVHMIGHDAKRIQFDMPVMTGQVVPGTFHDLPVAINFITPFTT